MIIDPSKNNVVCGDNEKWLTWLPDGCVDLCYIDPPFFSNQNYEILWGNGAELRSFGDRFAGGIEHYIDWMRDRVKIIHRKLKPTGSIFLHCDWHASHRLRCMLDEVFGDDNFRNEIIWRRTPFAGSSKALSKKLPAIHDTILYYSRSKEHDAAFTCPTEPYPPEYLKRFNNVDKRGKYQKVALKTYSAETLERLRREDRIVEPKTKGAGLRYKQYLHETKGVRQIGDMWVDINMINPMGNERLGYPTQKPEALIARVLEIGSKPGDLVLDCFAGGGTTAKTAADHGRRFIVGDVSPVAVKLIAERLNRQCPSTRYVVRNLPSTVDEYQAIDGHDFAALVCDLMGWTVNPKKSGDHGIDGTDGQGDPVQIKNNSKAAAGRPAIQRFHGAIVGAGKKRGVFVAWEFSRDARECIADLKRKSGIEIVAKPCSEVFGDLVLQGSDAESVRRLYRERFPKVWEGRVDAEQPTSPEDAVGAAVELLEAKRKKPAKAAARRRSTKPPKAS